MSNVKGFWDRASVKYDKLTMEKYSDAYNQTINISKQYLKSDDIAFDFACGTGITTISLADFVDQIDAIDISPKMIDLARSKADAEGIHNVEFSVSSIFEDTIKEGGYDVVMAFNILYFFEDIPEVLKRIYSLLKPNGIFLSATDCLASGKKITNMVTDMLNKVGVFPYSKKMSVDDLKGMIVSAGFDVVYEKNLFDNPPNLYIAARKH